MDWQPPRMWQHEGERITVFCIVDGEIYRMQAEHNLFVNCTFANTVDDGVVPTSP